MAKIKGYTDLVQSTKLAEILPLESADYHYIAQGEKSHFYPYALSREATKDYDEDIQYVPCWSLTALFNVMPQIDEWNTPYGYKDDKLFQFEPKICKVWEHSIIPSYKVTYGNEISTDIYDNPVDACVAMIEKLHELKML